MQNTNNDTSILLGLLWGDSNEPASFAEWCLSFQRLNQLCKLKGLRVNLPLKRDILVIYEK